MVKLNQHRIPNPFSIHASYRIGVSVDRGVSDIMEFQNMQLGDHFRKFLDKYYPVIERSKTSIPKNCMQMMLLDQLNGNTKWQDAEEHKLARINTRFTLAMADVERKAQHKTMFRNSLFCSWCQGP
jgi:uncharacterized FlgJ-related protein